MKKTSKARRVGSAFLAAAIVFTSFGASLTAFAADSWPNDKASAEPSFAGYRVKDIENWSPEPTPTQSFCVRKFLSRNVMNPLRTPRQSPI